MPVRAVAAPIEPAIDAVAPMVEALGHDVATRCVGARRCAIEPTVRTVPAGVRPVLDAVPFAVEPPLDAIAAIEPVAGIRNVLR